MFDTPERERVMLGESEERDRNVPVFNEGDPPTITVQTFSNDAFPGRRRPIPISTIDWSSMGDMHYVAGDGIDFLRGLDQIHIQQTVELSDLIGYVESINRYNVRVPQGETLFYATETSSNMERMCCGGNRSFVIKFFDHSQQEALRLKRTCSFGNQLMQVYSPQGELFGKIEKGFSFSPPLFVLYNSNNSIVYKIQDSEPRGYFSFEKRTHFKIYSPDGCTQLGSINNAWDQVNNQFLISVQFPNRNEDARIKSLIVGAAFLLEYVYFMYSKSSGRCCC